MNIEINDLYKWPNMIHSCYILCNIYQSCFKIDFITELGLLNDEKFEKMSSWRKIV